MKAFHRVTGRIAPLDLADVDTDQIIAKQFLKSIERTGYGQYLFYEWRKSGDFVLDRPEHRGARVLVTGPNFGCGSSREHAPWTLQEAGFDVIIAPSFADIFRNNCGNVGLLAVTLPEDGVRRLLDLATASPETEALVDLEAQTISAGDIQFQFEVEPFLKERLLNGWDEIGLTLRKLDRIEEYEKGRPAWMPAVV
ncbi:MAG: 3-isopropylmalate dehydratase small subunit [Candidatus Dormibacteraeota bacterium]|uniref:3-isopropylmalate dehydratase small subunit n=1 Tax=Candidatus Dormiibacter inghamiae TaxID=3127013 RepID=A0A934K8R8_9BACT|nr:3-isopropylmalate dehydratase small subunit [Candidatus Dormibacteraeota bacterium]MBJ7606307.1 3-isopropylmalate dehydratase small subunit [Candidatus Dormibacteraeota bacterium]